MIGVMQPTPERFRALARSSPWRFTTLRFTHTNRAPTTDPLNPVRAWLRRPALLRVARLDGELIQVVRQDRRTVGLLTFGGGGGGGGEFRQAWPHEVAPVADEGGLVRQRPSAPPDGLDRPDLRGVGYDDPMFRSYHWVAMLDPWELADPTEAGGDDDPSTMETTDVREVTHHDRPAWEAVLRPTPHYNPRCSCCPLLRSPQSDAREAEAGGKTARDTDPDFVYADAHQVRLDLETGVCVWTEQLGGTADGAGHDVAIEAVDEPMPDDLFPRRTGLLRRRR